MARRERVVGVAATIVVLVGIIVVIARGDDGDDTSTRADATTTTTTRRTTTTGAVGPTSTDAATSTTTAAPADTPASTVPAPTDPAPTDPTSPGPTDPCPPAAPPPPARTQGNLAAARVTLTPIASLPSPVAGAARPGFPGWLYIATRNGHVHLVDAGGGATHVLDISAETTVEGERGLLGIAVSDDGKTFILSFTDLNGDNRLDRFNLNCDGTIDVGSRATLLMVAHPTYANHNGGGVLFVPDGSLYWGLGDGGGGGDPFGNGQSLATLRGKLVRVDPGSGAATIAHYGLRNPWRFSFDRTTADLWIADVGQESWEEINWLPAGSGRANFEWSLREGLHAFHGERPADGTQPIWEYPHDGRCSVTGGYVYRGSRIPELVGAYLFSDICGGEVHALVQSGGHVQFERSLGVHAGGPQNGVASFAEDSAGDLYVLSFDNHVYRIDPA